MEDGKSVESEKTLTAATSASMEDMQRRMVLLEIEKNEKSSFDDVITGAESDNGWEDCWKETEDSVRSAPSEWFDEQATECLEQPTAPQSYYQLMDLNCEPVRHNRVATVPSQYQLDALSEMFIFDVPQHYTIVNRPTNCQSTVVPENAAVDYGTTPYFINSEYVSELLM